MSERFKQVDFLETKGKTVRAVVDADDEVIVSFTDNTFSVIGANRVRHDEVEMDTDGYFNELDHRLDLVLEPLFGEQGKAMREEAARQRETRAQQQRDKARAQRRKLLDALKAEFGD